MQWMRTDIRFGEPIKVFVLPPYEKAAAEVRDAVSQNDPPDELCRKLTKIVEFYRPDLAGGALLCIEFQQYRHSWTLTYSHPSMPRLAQNGFILPEEELLRVPEPSRFEQYKADLEAKYYSDDPVFAGGK
jgi:hypothetical protein